jgi:hypothetical protein
MCDITILLSEADRALAYLERIKNLYSETEAARYPFSRAWWRSDLPVTPVPIVVEWRCFRIVTFNIAVILRCFSTLASPMFWTTG